MIISRETIDEINRKVNIVDLVSQYAEVKHKGASYVACCPFHNEKTPSFNMSPEKGVYHCFGCGESGNIFSFLMKISGLSFQDAALELANKFGIEVKYTDVKFQDSKKDIDALYKVNVLAYKYFEYSLKVNFNLLKDYLESRKISAKQIKEFYIGFCPNNWQGLYDYLKKAKVPENIMEQSGLFYRNKNGNLYDVFRGRLMFPVLSMPKKIAGFGGRIIPSIASKMDMEKSPKYLNSKETLVYEKSKILYNFVNARDEIKRQKFLFLVEGYMDVVGLSRVNVRNVIATCGTSLTYEHAKKIENLNVDVIVMFDADNAGYNAAARAFSIFLNTKINAQALFLPSGEDPDSLADKEGDNTLNVLKNLPKISLLEAFFKKLLRDENIDTINKALPAVKQRIADKLIEVVSKIQSSIKRLEVMKEASFLLQVPLELLSSEVKQASSNVIRLDSFKKDYKSDNLPNDTDSKKKTKVSLSSLLGIDREVISISFRDISYIDKILQNSNICQVLNSFTLDFLASFNNSMQQSMQQIAKNSHNDSHSDLYEEIKKVLQFYGQEYVSLYNTVNSPDSNFNLEGAYKQCETLAQRILKEDTIRDLEREIQLTKDENKRLTLTNSLFKLMKNS